MGDVVVASASFVVGSPESGSNGGCRNRRNDMFMEYLYSRNSLEARVWCSDVLNN